LDKINTIFKSILKIKKKNIPNLNNKKYIRMKS